MIFADKLEELKRDLCAEFDSLFELAISNQKHKGDMLLWYVNGGYIKDYEGSDLSPYVIGPNNEGDSEKAHYEFIKHYREHYIFSMPYLDYLKELEYSPEKEDDINALTEMETLTIQLEMLVYLKFWEADMSIKRLYQLTRILLGENYDWHFKLGQKRGGLIEPKIIKKIKSKSTLLHEAMKIAYKAQIRNSIAHSNYSFLGRNIHPNNFKKEGDIEYLTFDKWIEMFHITLILHGELIRLQNKIFKYYSELALDGEQLTVQTVDVDSNIIDEREIIYLEDRKRFKYT